MTENALEDSCIYEHKGSIYLRILDRDSVRLVHIKIGRISDGSVDVQKAADSWYKEKDSNLIISLKDIVELSKEVLNNE